MSNMPIILLTVTGKIKCCVLRGSLIHGHFLLFSYFTFMTYTKAQYIQTVSFADVTGIIIINPNPLAFINEIKKLFYIYIYI
jgi:uncharacterized membrane protein